MKIIKSPPFLVFILIAFLIGIPSLYISTLQASVGILLLLFLLSSYGVGIAAFISLRYFHQTKEYAELIIRLKTWRNSPGNYLISIGIPTLIWLLTALIVPLLGKTTNPLWIGLASFPIIFITNFGEEIGWRGFALPHLIKSYTPLGASIILGLIWGAYHFPLYWQNPIFSILFLAFTPAFSILITWLFIRSKGSIFLSTLIHATYNAWGQVFLGTNKEQIMAVSVGVSWVLVILILARYGVSLSYSPDSLSSEVKHAG
jgi:membrane protease YdiL (CAAX protease family)